MALRLILGGAGSGKSHLCLEEISNQQMAKALGSPLLLIVPDQASFVMEWGLLNQGKVEGSFRAEVLSFSRLYEVLKAEEGLAELPWLDDLGKSMLISQSLAAHQGEFQVFAGVSKHRGFLDSLLTITNELTKYKITPDAMLVAAGVSENPLIAGKLQDLALIYGDVLAKLQQGYLDDTLVLARLAAAIPQSQWLKGAEIWVDGFSELNPAQLQVIKALLQHCKQLNFALCLPPAQIPKSKAKIGIKVGGSTVFVNLQKTYRQLVALGQEVAATKQIAVQNLETNYRQAATPILAELTQAFAEKNFAAAINQNCGEVRLISAVNPRQELAFVAQEINRLAKDCGYKLGEIAVITRTLEDYAQPITEVFQEYDLPYFADIPKPLRNHPVLEILQAALEAVGEDWQNGAVLRYLKTDLAGISLAEVDVLENYALANGIRNKMWQKAGSWEKYYVDREKQLGVKKAAVPEEKARLLAEVNLIGKQAFAPLLKFDKALNQGGLTIGQGVVAMRDLLADLQIEQSLADLAKIATEKGDLEIAQGHQQILSQLELIFSQLEGFLGSSLADSRQLAELLQEGSYNLELNIIPPSVDEVVVADINRSRLPELKVAFVVGCNEGVFPTKIVEDSIFNSSEREELQGVGLELAASQRQQQFGEDYHIYMALTRASQKLYLTYALADLAGAELKPSIILSNLQRFLPNLEQEQVANQPALNSLVSKDPILTGLGKNLLLAKNGKVAQPKTADFWWQVYNYYEEEGGLEQEIAAIRRGLAYDKDESRLSQAALNQLYGSMDSTSVSRLETFNNCPCRYYARYGLALEPRFESKIRSLDIGLIYHFILAEVLKTLAEAGVAWGSLTMAEVLPKTQAALDEFLAQGLANIIDDSGKNRYLKAKILAVVSQNVLDAAAQLALGDFVPVGFELSFGKSFGEGETLPGYTITLDSLAGAAPKQIEIRGQMDRVDEARVDGKSFYRIIDYKMANKNLTVADIYYGLNWQLPVYMEALLQAKGGLPAGMFYIPVRDVVTSVADGFAPAVNGIKLQGLAILDFQAVGLAERGLLENMGFAETMSLRIKKDGSFAQTKSGITPQEYNLLQAYLGRALKDRMSKIMAGEISQKPVSKKNQPICSYCDYGAICAIDKDLAMAVQPLKDLSNQQIFGLIRGEIQGKADILINNLAGEGQQNGELD